MNKIKVEVELGLKEYEIGDIFLYKDSPKDAYILCKYAETWVLISLESGKVVHQSYTEYFQPPVALNLRYLGSCNIQITKLYTTEQ